MVSTTGEQFAYYELDEELKPVEKPFPERLRKSVGLIEDNCEPALCTVLFVGGAGGSLRAGVVENPVNLTRSVQGLKTYVTVGGAPVYVWPGGGITLMVDVTRVPENAFGYVPTPALVAPIEFTLRRDDYLALGGHAAEIRTLDDIVATGGEYLNPRDSAGDSGRQSLAAAGPIAASALAERAVMNGPQAQMPGRRAPAASQSRADRPDRRGVRRCRRRCRAAYAQAVARFQTILAELVEELPELRRAGGRGRRVLFAGPPRGAWKRRCRRWPKNSSRRWPRSPDR